MDQGRASRHEVFNSGSGALENDEAGISTPEDLEEDLGIVEDLIND